MNKELLSIVVHTALHAWQALPSPHAEVGEHIASATMHADDGTIYVVSVVEVLPLVGHLSRVRPATGPMLPAVTDGG